MYDIAFLKTYEGKLMASGNAVEVIAAITPYYTFIDTKNVYAIINISVQSAPDSAVFTLIKSQKVYADNSGMVTIDISSMAEAYLSYFVPPVDVDNYVKCTQQIKLFKVAVALYNDGVLVKTITDTVTIIKAGSSYDAPLTLSNTAEMLLAITTEEEKCSINDVFFLYLLIPPVAYQLSIDFIVKFLNVDGGEQEIMLNPFAKIANETKAKIICIPVSFENIMQAGDLPYGAIPISFTIEFNFVDGGFNLSNINPVTYVLEQRNFYKTKQLLYRSSLGSLMPIRLNGNIETEANYDYQTSGRAAISYIQDGNITGTSFQDNTTEEFKCKGDTGFITQFEVERLRDFYLSSQRWEVVNERLVPIIVNNKSVKYGTNSDNLYNMLIEWQYAFKNNFFSLAAVPSLTCPPMLNFFAKQIIANQLRIFYALPNGYHYFKVTLTFPGEDPQYFFQDGNKGVFDISFIRPASAAGAVTVNLLAQVVCQRYNKVPGYGTAFSHNVALAATVTPIGAVANNDIFNLVMGFITPQTMPVSILANDYDAANQVLTAVAVTGVATTQGGLISINTAGIVTYTPPSGTYTGADTYTYQMIAGSNPAVTGLITFNIANNVSTIFATIRYDYPIGFIYHDLYMQFKNAAGYFGTLVNVNNVVVNYKKIVSVTNSGGPLGFDGTPTVTETNYTATFSGTETRIFIGPLQELVEQVDYSYNKIVTAMVVLPGVGYNVG